MTCSSNCILCATSAVILLLKSISKHCKKTLSYLKLSVLWILFSWSSQTGLLDQEDVAKTYLLKEITMQESARIKDTSNERLIISINQGDYILLSEKQVFIHFLMIQKYSNFLETIFLKSRVAKAVHRSCGCLTISPALFPSECITYSPSKNTDPISAVCSLSADR